MAQQVRFTKMHGAGNDYIYVDTSLYNIPDPTIASTLWSDRHKGIGSDGLVLIGRSPVPEADFTMRIFNADGSEAMMCGNASRCIGKYLYEKGLTTHDDIRLLTQSGIKNLHLNLNGSAVSSVTVDMLEPQFIKADQFDLPMTIEPDVPLVAEGKQYKGTFVSMGNPHFVIFVNNINDLDVAHAGACLERHPAFPQRSNIEFASIQADGSIRMRVWERGSGITLACGTGACATAVAAALTHRAPRKSKIVMDGGTLDIEWRETDNRVYMTGPAEFVYEGVIEIQ